MIRVLSIDDDGATPHGGGHADAAVIYGMATITGDANGPRWRPRTTRISRLAERRAVPFPFKVQTQRSTGPWVSIRSLLY